MTHFFRITMCSCLLPCSRLLVPFACSAQGRREDKRQLSSRDINLTNGGAGRISGGGL